MKFIKFKVVFIFIISIFSLNLNANVDGVRIQIIEAGLYGTVHIPLLDKRIKSKNDIFTIGQINASTSTKKLYKDDEFYILTIEDKYSKGKLNAIVKGSYLKKYPHYINTLTEITFLLSKDFIGKNYDKVALEKNLDKIAKKIIKEKGFVLDDIYEINYSDILLYENGSKVLYKPFIEYLKPLEQKIKSNTLKYDDAIKYVYERPIHKKVSNKSRVEKIQPLYRLVVFLHIPQNTKLGTEIVKLEKLREGSAKVDSFEILNNAVPFRMTKEGKLFLAKELDEESYSFEAVAHTKDGDSNKISFTIVIDNVEDTKFYNVK